MRISRFKIVFIILSLILIFSGQASTEQKEPAKKSPQKFSVWERWFAHGDKWLYMRAVDSAQAGSGHFALMDFTRLEEEYPESELADDALFAAGEYYFQIGDYYDAFYTFNRCVNKYPQSEIELFALGYLLKIAAIKEKSSLIEELEKEIVAAQQASLLFRDFKEYEYLSPFSKNYKAACFIDKIEFYIDGELFARISF